MAAYVIVEIEVTDPAKFEEYKPLAAKTVAAHGGRYLARGGAMEVLEGAPHPGRAVILEFPSVEAVHQWHASAEYEVAKKIRQASAKTRMLVVEGAAVQPS